MNWQKSILVTELRKPLFALVLASSCAVMAVIVRAVVTHHFRPLSLVWNLFLAVVPLAFAAMLELSCWRNSRRSVKAAMFCGWLFFFPNAPYILTDFVHLKSRWHPQFWTELSGLLLFAWCGALAGFLSLYIVQRLVSRRFGFGIGWVFSLGIAALTGVGIFLGRVERWNSWDLLIHPIEILADVARLGVDALHRGPTAKMALLFSMIVFLGHVTLYSLLRSNTRLHANDIRG
jgi:uncharacterized membrane protein